MSVKKQTSEPKKDGSEQIKEGAAPSKEMFETKKDGSEQIKEGAGSRKVGPGPRKEGTQQKKAQEITAHSVEQWEILSKIFLVIIYIPLLLVIRELANSDIIISGIPYLVLDWILPLIVADALHRYYLEEHQNRNLRWIVYSGVYFFGLLMLTNSLTYYTFMLGGFYGLLLVFTKRFGYSIKQHMLSCLIASQIVVVLRYFTDIITIYGALLLFSIAIMIVFFEKEFKMILQEQRIPRFRVDAITRMVGSEIISVAVAYCLLHVVPEFFINQYDFKAIQNLMISLPITLVFYVLLVFWPKIVKRFKKS